ncbi:MAG TPA: serine/threonine-protein kinase [Labilithrix sp.]|jgi:serine/threonine-protein kinase
MDGGCASSARDRLGRVLGKYRLDDVLGAGGTSIVYAATEVTTGSRVAVKLLHDYLSRSAEVCRRFVREGYLSNMIGHPGMVRVVDDGTSDTGEAYLVLELLEGETLEQRRLSAGGTLPVDEVLGYGDALLAVLEAAHAQHVVHRDIKPSNLLVTKDGVLKVLDFGIARIVDDGPASATKTGQMVGTPAFMPPEQALSRPREVDARTDLWAVGATMFTLLSGETVHVAESSSEHLVKAATVPARSLVKALPAVPANVEALVAKALEFSKSERWQSASEMRAELAKVRKDPGHRIGISTGPPSRRLKSELPTYVTGDRPEPSSGRISEATMSLTGEHPRTTSARPIGAAIAIAFALVLGAFGIFAALRTGKPAAASEAHAQATVAPEPPPPAIDPPPPPTATASEPAAKPKPIPVAPLKPKAATKPAPSFDVYRPF